jgi:hypothetical protein
LQSIADGIAQDLDRWFMNPNVPARLIITRLAGHDVKLAPGEMMTILGLLRANGHLGAFLGLVPYPKDSDYPTIGALLRRNKVPIEFVHQNFDVGWVQYNDFFIGFLEGAASSAIESLVFMARVLGNIALDLLAATAASAGVIDAETEKSWRRSPQEFFAAVQQFIFHPLVALSAGAKRFIEAYQKAIYELDFYSVGRINGELVVFLLTLPGAAKSTANLIGRGGRAVAAAAVNAAKLSFEQLLALVPRADLARFVSGPSPVFVSGTNVLVATEDLAVVLDADGKTLGSIQMSEIFDDLGGSIQDIREQLGEGPEADAVQEARGRADVQLTRERPGRRGRRTEPAETDIGESPAERARLRNLAQEFHEKFLGNDPDIEVTLRRIQRTEAGRAQSRAVTPEDSPGAIEHELVITIRDQNITFSPDGVEPLGEGHYAFREHKEVLSVWERPDLTRASRIKEFRAMMERDVIIQRWLSEYDCDGFIYSTNSRDVLYIFAELIAEFKRSGISVFSVKLVR